MRYSNELHPYFMSCYGNAVWTPAAGGGYRILSPSFRMGPMGNTVPSGQYVGGFGLAGGPGLGRFGSRIKKKIKKVSNFARQAVDACALISDPSDREDCEVTLGITGCDRSKIDEICAQADNPARCKIAVAAGMNVMCGAAPVTVSIGPRPQEGSPVQVRTPTSSAASAGAAALWASSARLAPGAPAAKIIGPELVPPLVAAGAGAAIGVLGVLLFL